MPSSKLFRSIMPNIFESKQRKINIIDKKVLITTSAEWLDQRCRQHLSKSSFTRSPDFYFSVLLLRLKLHLALPVGIFCRLTHLRLGALCFHRLALLPNLQLQRLSFANLHYFLGGRMAEASWWFAG